MTTYQLYQQARDAAWKTLLRYQVSQLPTDVEAIARQLGIAIITDLQEDRELAAILRRLSGASCFSLCVHQSWMIVLTETIQTPAARRFAIAHELGHRILRHGLRGLSPGVSTFQSAENQGDLIESPATLDDYTADIFAIRLLAPACVLHGLNISTQAEIEALCGLPPRAAALRAERMELLNERNVYYQNPLEKQVFSLFQSWVDTLKTPLWAQKPPQAEISSAMHDAPAPQAYPFEWEPLQADEEQLPLPQIESLVPALPESPVPVRQEKPPPASIQQPTQKPKHQAEEECLPIDVRPPEPNSAPPVVWRVITFLLFFLLTMLILLACTGHLYLT